MTELAIQTVNLVRRFGSVSAVDGLSLHVPRGCVYGFLGPNGAGKTTTIRLLLGLIRADRGDVRLFGESLTPTTRRTLLRQIGSIVEAPSLYPHLTGTENLRATQELAGLDRARIGEVLRIVRLERDADRLVQAYSQGMRQRLGIALALLGKPNLLILDEPTGGLDPAGIREIRELLRALPAEHGITIFLSSHLLAEMEHVATHVGILGLGRLVFEGTLKDLLSRHAARVMIEVDKPQSASLILRDRGVDVERAEGSSLTLKVNGRAEVALAASRLVSAGINLYELRAERPTLEEIFLELTRTAELGCAGEKKASR